MFSSKIIACSSFCTDDKQSKIIAVVSYNDEIEINYNFDVEKYNLKKWVQPILSSNSSYGTMSASSVAKTEKDCWHISNNVYSADSADWWEMVADVKQGWLKWQLEEKILIKSIRLISKGGNYTAVSGSIYTDETKTTKICDFSNPSASAFKECVITNANTELVRTDCIYIEITNGDKYCGLSEIIIDAFENYEDSYIDIVYNFDTFKINVEKQIDNYDTSKLINRNANYNYDADVITNNLINKNYDTSKLINNTQITNYDISKVLSNDIVYDFWNCQYKCSLKTHKILCSHL